MFEITRSGDICCLKCCNCNKDAFYKPTASVILVMLSIKCDLKKKHLILLIIKCLYNWLPATALDEVWTKRSQ